MPIELEVLLPVHNEAESIERTVAEIYDAINPVAAMRFIICEDGSSDGTPEILRKLGAKYPVNLFTGGPRKGYSQAVLLGMRAMEAPYLLCLDSDGQCDPKDFPAFWEARHRADVVIGWRVNRADTTMRRLMSRAFYRVYQIFYNTPVNDPSCPFILVPKNVIARLAPELGVMQQGFWWEFVARAHRRMFSIVELPVRHRLRAAGMTQVYKIEKLPGIGYRHFMALFRIWRETRTEKASAVGRPA